MSQMNRLVYMGLLKATLVLCSLFMFSLIALLGVWWALSACLHRQFHTLPGLLDSQAVLTNSYPKMCVPSTEAVCTIILMVFGMTWLGREPTTYCMGWGHTDH